MKLFFKYFNLPRYLNVNVHSTRT